MGNELVFTFPYSKLCIKSVVDLIHGINVDSIDLVTLLEIMKFLNYEDKGKILQLKRWSMTEIKVSSQFEKNVLEILEKKLTEAKIPLDTKLLVCHICNSFDNYKGALEKV